MMKRDLMKSLDFADIFETIEKFPRKITDDKVLMQLAEMPKFKIKNRFINEQRKLLKSNIEKEMEKLYFMKEEYKGTY